MSNVKLISGTANRKLAEEISKTLKIPLTPVEIKRFHDGEIYCRVLESVRGCDVYIIQPTSPDASLNLMELLIMVDALRRSSPEKITAVIPYFGYCRQDKKTKPREPITAKLVANMIQAAGVNRVIMFDLHVAQVQGFFDIPTDNLDLIPDLADYIIKKKLKHIVIVSPDAGGAARARSFAKVLHVPIAIIDKRRPEPNVAEVQHVIGDVQGKIAVMIDDLIDTAGSITGAANILIKHGAKEVYVLATHGVLSDPATERIKKSGIKEVVVSNTIAIPKEKILKKIKILSVGPLLAETIKRTHEGLPMGLVYENMYKKLEKKLRS
ncbi:ribose-phosphate pyrophosphokinase [Candidatus Woesearchaeota archaeon]|jgi:ribose-phosphate pyrophosphokinase|nr:ribose-phosphate pyrophosphokinase [Candidatus Woesearchaeota archaeon]|tara:strand:- start:12964 stop:13935 length:972 start_codon:yes stop_codon:yes gene_type:complete